MCGTTSIPRLVRIGRRRVLATLWPTAALIAGQALWAGSAAAHTPAVNAAAALETSRVAVDPAVWNVVSVSDAATLAGHIGQQPVFVVVLPQSSGRFELVEIESIHRVPGIYLLAEGEQLQAGVLGFGGITARQASDVARAAAAAKPHDMVGTLDAAVTGELAALQQYGAPRSGSDPPPDTGSGQSGRPVGLTVAVGAGLVLLVVGGMAVALRDRGRPNEPLGSRQEGAH